MKKVAVLQSSYIPWKGYFDIINSVDEFILYDDAQYTRRDWRNRNKIITPQGVQWLTIPVLQYDFKQKIKDTRVVDAHWQAKHWRSIQQNYKKAPYFKLYAEVLSNLYTEVSYEKLSEINYAFIKIISNLLGCKTRFSWSMDYPLAEEKSARLLKLVQDVGGTTYVSGPTAKSYLNEPLFAAANIAVQWIDYDNYPPYPQLGNQSFEHNVSILDLLFNEGPNITKFMKSFHGQPLSL